MDGATNYINNAQQCPGMKHGKFDQLQFANCGFKSVGDQMKLTKLIKVIIKQNNSAAAATIGIATDKLTLVYLK